jgi:hypothetical protein
MRGWLSRDFSLAPLLLRAVTGIYRARYCSRNPPSNYRIYLYHPPTIGSACPGADHDAPRSPLCVTLGARMAGARATWRAKSAVAATWGNRRGFNPWTPGISEETRVAAVHCPARSGRIRKRATGTRLPFLAFPVSRRGRCCRCDRKAEDLSPRGRRRPPPRTSKGREASSRSDLELHATQASIEKEGAGGGTRSHRTTDKVFTAAIYSALLASSFSLLLISPLLPASPPPSSSQSFPLLHRQRNPLPPPLYSHYHAYCSPRFLIALLLLGP